MFHVCANTLAIGAVADTDIPAVSDDILPLNASSHFLLPNDFWLVGAAVMSPTIIRANLTSASLRQITIPNIRPLIGAAIPPSNPNVLVQVDAPLRLPAGDELSVKGTAAPGATERFTAVWFLSLGLDPVPSGDLYIARCTSTTAAVANVWTTIAYTFDQALPPGQYALVGSEHISANGIAHRFIIPGQVWRPGSLSMGAVGNSPNILLQSRRFGQYGVFNNVTPPICQVLANGADAVHTLFLYLVKIG